MPSPAPPPSFSSFFPLLSIAHSDLRDQTFPSSSIPSPLKRSVRRKEAEGTAREESLEEAVRHLRPPLPPPPRGETLDNECVGNGGEASSCQDLSLECARAVTTVRSGVRIRHELLSRTDGTIPRAEAAALSFHKHASLCNVVRTNEASSRGCHGFLWRATG